jgi:hypothetical protein
MNQLATHEDQYTRGKGYRAEGLTAFITKYLDT